VTATSGTPTGSVQFTVDGADVGRPVPLSTNTVTSNLVVNGSFEDPSAASAWILTNNTQVAPPPFFYGVVPPDGTHFVVIQNDLGAVSQDVPGFVVGAPYTLTFFLAAGGADSSVEVAIGDAIRHTFTAPKTPPSPTSCI